uniref:uncharacterized protein LOC122580388 n=1 Tax=Erigeron canadensis TaxID=72917 RepID=UPI001CB8F6FB|nr:uncharacterized protein LOC122580388 [Erigeron canadensis]
MDSTVSIDPIDRSELESATLGQKRPLPNGFESFENELGYKKAKLGEKDVKLDVKRVAEIVLVLATMGRMRGGRKPSEVEVEMMREARAKLADVCKEFAPKDIFPGDRFGSVIEDLGLNKLGDHKLGVSKSKLTISEKVLVTKRKMEKSEVFPLYSDMYIPPQQPSGATTANSRTLPYQLPTSEVKPGGSNSLRSGKDYSSVTRSLADSPHFRVDGGANGSYPSHSQGKTPARSMQSPSPSVTKGVVDMVLAHSSVKAEGLSDITTARVSGQGITSKPSITQVPPNPMITNQHRMNFIRGPSLAETHREVSKIVQTLLQPYLLKDPTWTSPSRDYMSKPLPCQMCKAIINEVDTTVVCDACERGYHLKCQSNPKYIPRDEWQEWHCAKCLAISNGKPIPPKYGRVMRNISTPKLSSNSAVDQPSSDKKMRSDVNVSQQTTATNGIVGNYNKQTAMQLNQKQECREENAPVNTCVSCLVEGSNDEKLKIVSESQPLANLEESHDSDNNKIPRSITDMLAKQSQNSNLLENIPEISSNGAIEEDRQGESRKTSEIGILVDEQEVPSSSSMHEVEWVGAALKEIDGKTYYQSCCINGIVYKVKDYALFTSPTNKYIPNRLEAMWEDGKTTNKWVNVSRCFFPDDLPEGVGHPCAPESNEVYESNHESTLAAGLIHSSCEVLPPSKFSEESAMQTRLMERGKESRKPVFLCKWFYDETKRLFRDVTC